MEGKELGLVVLQFNRAGHRRRGNVVDYQRRMEEGAQNYRSLERARKYTCWSSDGEEVAGVEVMKNCNITHTWTSGTRYTAQSSCNIR